MPSFSPTRSIKFQHCEKKGDTRESRCKKAFYRFDIFVKSEKFVKQTVQTIICRIMRLNSIAA